MYLAGNSILQIDPFAIKFDSNQTYNDWAEVYSAYPQTWKFQLGDTVYVTPYVYTSSTLGLGDLSSWSGYHWIKNTGIWNTNMVASLIHEVKISSTEILSALNRAMNYRNVLCASDPGYLENSWVNIEENNAWGGYLHSMDQLPVRIIDQGTTKGYFLTVADQWFGSPYIPTGNWREIGTLTPTPSGAYAGNWMPGMSTDVLNWIAGGTWAIPNVTMSATTKSALPILPELYAPEQGADILNNMATHQQAIYPICSLASTNNPLSELLANSTPMIGSTSNNIFTETQVGFTPLAPVYLTPADAKALAPAVLNGSILLSKKPYLVDYGFWANQGWANLGNSGRQPLSDTLGIDNTYDTWTQWISNTQSDVYNDIYQYFTSTTAMPSTTVKKVKTTSAATTSTANLGKGSDHREGPDIENFHLGKG